MRLLIIAPSDLFRSRVLISEVRLRGCVTDWVANFPLWVTMLFVRRFATTVFSRLLTGLKSLDFRTILVLSFSTIRLFVEVRLTVCLLLPVIFCLRFRFLAGFASCVFFVLFRSLDFLFDVIVRGEVLVFLPGFFVTVVLLLADLVTNVRVFFGTTCATGLLIREVFAGLNFLLVFTLGRLVTNFLVPEDLILAEELRGAATLLGGFVIERGLAVLRGRLTITSLRTFRLPELTFELTLGRLVERLTEEGLEEDFTDRRDELRGLLERTEGDELRVLFERTADDELRGLLERTAGDEREVFAGAEDLTELLAEALFEPLRLPPPFLANAGPEKIKAKANVRYTILIYFLFIRVDIFSLLSLAVFPSKEIKWTTFDLARQNVLVFI